MHNDASQRESLSPIACDMNAIPAAQREGHFATSKELFSLILEIQELPNGYAFRLAEGAHTLLKAAEFISLEKLCCPFSPLR